MTSLIFPDVNVWLAILLEQHAHRNSARAWWDNEESGDIAFTRLTQLGLLRLLTTAAVMSGRPLTMSVAWAAYDQLYTDDRVVFVDEPRDLDRAFRSYTSGGLTSPKLWADAWLLAVAQLLQARIVTFDKGLASHSKSVILLS